MVSFLKKSVCPIGVEMDSDVLRMAQLACDGKRLCLVAGASEQIPSNITPGSSDCQKWVVKTVKELIAKGSFRGRKVITAMPAADVFIDQIKVPETEPKKLQNVVSSEIQSKLPFETTDAMIKYVITEPIARDSASVSGSFGSGSSELDILVMAIERTKVDRHLAICERADLHLQSIGVWPLAMTNSYARFFARRKTDIEAIAMLLEMGAGFTKVVICRHKNLLFARLIPAGARQLADLADGKNGRCAEVLQNENPTMMKKLASEIEACARHFESLSGPSRIERLVLFSSQTAELSICQSIAQLAKHLQIPAQVGDVLAAVEANWRRGLGIDRRDCSINWATTFGLSLS